MREWLQVLISYFINKLSQLVIKEIAKLNIEYWNKKLLPIPTKCVVANYHLKFKHLWHVWFSF